MHYGKRIIVGAGGDCAEVGSAAILETLPWRDSVDPAPLESLIGEIENYDASPGLDNPESFNETHPDIYVGCANLAPLWFAKGLARVPVTTGALPDVDPRNPMLLVGGPGGNLVSRDWQGFVQNPETNVFEFMKPPVTKVRWRYEFGFGAQQQGPQRYVNGMLKRAWRTAILDNASGEPRFAGRGQNDMMEDDVLMIHYVPNQFHPGCNSWFDFADLHGQGERIIHSILSDPAIIDGIRRELPAGGPAGAHYFQALVRVWVKHDDTANLTTPTDYELIETVLLS